MSRNQKRDDLIIDCHLMGLGHAEIAVDFGITRERVRQIVKERLGVSTPLKLKGDSRRQDAIAALVALEEGRTLEEVAMDRDGGKRRLAVLLRRHAGLDPRQVSFQAWMAAQIGKRFNFWEVLAIHPVAPGSYSSARCRIKAKCLKCGTIHEVNYRNISTGASRMCRSCGAKHRNSGIPVVDVNSAALFPSIKHASESSGLSYHKVRRNLLSGQAGARFRRASQGTTRSHQGTTRRPVAP